MDTPNFTNIWLSLEFSNFEDAMVSANDFSLPRPKIDIHRPPLEVSVSIK